MFIKRGDGKIVGVVEPDKLTDDEKKAVKQVTEIVKESDDSASSKQQKKLGS